MEPVQPSKRTTLGPISVRAVAFDLDGTLFDHAFAARAGLASWLQTVGIELDAELERAWFAAEQRTHELWRDGVIGWLEQRRIRLREFLPLVGVEPGSDEELDVLFRDGYLRAYEDAWVGFDDVEECLAAITGRGFRVGLLTNGSEQQQRAKLARLGILDKVGPVFTAERLGVAKPKPDAFLRVCEALQLPPELVLYVGDDHEVDVEGARLAGLRALHLDRSRTNTTDSISSLRELSDMLTLA